MTPKEQIAELVSINKALLNLLYNNFQLIEVDAPMSDPYRDKDELRERMERLEEEICAENS